MPPLLCQLNFWTYALAVFFNVADKRIRNYGKF